MVVLLGECQCDPPSLVPIDASESDLFCGEKEWGKGGGTCFSPLCRVSLLGYGEAPADLVWRAGPEGKAWGEKQRRKTKNEPQTHAYQMESQG